MKIFYIIISYAVIWGLGMFTCYTIMKTEPVNKDGYAIKSYIDSVANIPIAVDGDELPGIAGTKTHPDTCVAYYSNGSVHLKYIK